MRVGARCDDRAGTRGPASCAEVELLRLSLPPLAVATTEASQAPLAAERAAGRAVTTMAAWLGPRAVAPAAGTAAEVRRAAVLACGLGRCHGRACLCRGAVALRVLVRSDGWAGIQVRAHCDDRAGTWGRASCAEVGLLHLSLPRRMAVGTTEASQAPLAVERAAGRGAAMMAAWLGRQAVALAVVEGWKVEKQAHVHCGGRDLAGKWGRARCDDRAGTRGPASCAGVELLHLSLPRLAAATTEASQAPLAAERAGGAAAEVQKAAMLARGLGRCHGRACLCCGAVAVQACPYGRPYHAAVAVQAWPYDRPYHAVVVAQATSYGCPYYGVAAAWELCHDHASAAVPPLPSLALLNHSTIRSHTAEPPRP